MAETILAPPGSRANKRTIEEKLLSAIDRMREAQDSMNLIRAKTNAEIGPSDTKEIARKVEDLARVVRLLSRDALSAFDAST